MVTLPRLMKFIFFPNHVNLSCIFLQSVMTPVAEVIKVKCPDHPPSESMVLDELGLFPLEIILPDQQEWKELCDFT